MAATSPAALTCIFLFQIFPTSKYSVTDLTLEHGVVLGGEGGDLEAEVPGLLVPDHGVAGEAGQLPLHAQPEPVLGPLQHPDLVSHHTRQHNLQRGKCQLYVIIKGFIFGSTKIISYMPVQVVWWKRIFAFLVKFWA